MRPRVCASPTAEDYVIGLAESPSQWQYPLAG